MILNTIKSLWTFRYGNIRFRLMDLTCIGYMALIGFLLIFFHKTVTFWPNHVLIHIVFVVGILEIVRLGEIYSQKKILWILRTFYPLVIFLYGWDELNSLVPMFYGTYWTTEHLVQLDKFIFGVHPTVWVQQFYRPWLDEFMCISYTAYYAFYAIIPLYFYLSKKREELFAIFFIVLFTILSNFFLFYIFPATGPQRVLSLQALQIQSFTGYCFCEITRAAQAGGSVTGAAFPSSHVAAALAWVLSARRYNRKLGYAISPIALGVSLSAVYLGLHHAVDVILGALWAVACYFIAVKLLQKEGNTDKI